jgi:hypothetical protein
MSETLFPGQSTIIASTSDYFPIDADIQVAPIQTDAARVQIRLLRPGQEPEDLFETDVPAEARRPDRSLQGDFRNRQTCKILIGLMTLCPGKTRRLLVGRITSPEDRIDEGGTGVWVAEERPKEPPVE